MFDKKILRRNLIILILLMVLGVSIYGIVRTFARYTSSLEEENTLTVAFWFVEAGYKDETIFVQDIMPSNNKYEYTFSVSNNDGTKVAQTDMELEINLLTTTNLPLNYELYRKVDSLDGVNAAERYESGEKKYRKIPITKVSTLEGVNGNYYILTPDSDGTYYKNLVYTLGYDSNKLTIQKGTQITDEYLILVEFPNSYKNIYQYQDLVDYIKLGINARQIIEE